jgi:predicted O-methyltransferase YrrM
MEDLSAADHVPARNRKAQLLLDMVARAPRGLVVEVGCLRQVHEVATDGFSTWYLARRCLDLGLDFRSCDLDPTHAALANEVLQAAGLAPCVMVGDGSAILKALGPVSLLYLDSSDDPRDTLDQYEVATLMPGAIVVVDDAQAYASNRLGKATLLAERLTEDRIPFDLVPTEPGFLALVVRLSQGKACDLGTLEA